MSQVATNRLIDAAATLPPADRALLNMWANRGLDDAAVARMTGMSADTIASRRARIVEHLSAVLGLPPEDIRRVLTDITPSPEVRSPANVVAELVPPRGDPPGTDATAGPATRPGTGAASWSRRWLWTAAAALVAIVVVVVLIASLGASGGAGHHRRPTAPSYRSAPASSTTAAPTTAASTPAASTTAAAGSGVASPPAEPLVALPPGLAHTTGTVQMTGSQPHLRLNLSVSNLPALSRGHYEVWLYDSLVNSESLGRLGAGDPHVSLPLPKDARRYRWVDVSVQPAGVIFHSGESVLRSANPVFAAAAASRP